MGTFGSCPGMADIGVSHSGHKGATRFRVYSGGRCGQLCVERLKWSEQKGWEQYWHLRGRKSMRLHASCEHLWPMNSISSEAWREWLGDEESIRMKAMVDG